MKKKNKTKQKRVHKYGNILDLLIIPVYICLASLLTYTIYSYSTKFSYVCIFVSLIILIGYIYCLKSKGLFTILIRKLFILLICGCMIFVIIKFQSFNSFFDDLGSDSTPLEEISTHMSAYSLADNEFFDAKVETIDDLDKKIVGIQISTDIDASTYVQKQLDTSYEDIEYKEFTSYDDMLSSLYLGYIDCAIINKASVASYTDAYNFNETFIYLTEFTHTTTLGTTASDKDITSEPFSVLISGSDEEGNYSKSDMNMLLLVNPVTNQVNAISIPRDAYIPNPHYDNQSDKLTHTGANGIQNTVVAIEHAFEIDVDFFIKVSFTSIIEIVNTIGGIEVDVPITFCEQDENRSFEEEDLICINQGLQTLDGQQALAYSRHRSSYINQDLGRNEAQINVVKGIINTLLTPSGLTSKMDDLLNILPKYVITNFTTNEIKTFIKFQIDNLQPWSINAVSLDKGISAFDYTASMPQFTSSVYYLGTTDVLEVKALHDAFDSSYTFNDFSFDIDSLFERDANYHNYYNITTY